MITLSCKLELDNEDKLILDDLCRRWSSAMHTAFNHPEISHQELMIRFNLSYRYAHTAIVDAKALISSREELGLDNKVIFGSKKKFEKLQKRHLDPEKLKEIKKYNLYSIGDRSKFRKGNANIQLYGSNLRITTNNRKFIFATIHSK